jgi:hypothetical protein
VAAIVSRLVTATPSSAHGAHHGHDSLWGSALYAIADKSIAAARRFRRVNFRFRHKSIAGGI